MLVRFIRLRDAYDYLGMDKNRFNSEVRPYLTECPSSNKWDGSDFRLSECFARHFHVTRRIVDIANDVSRWSFV